VCSPLDIFSRYFLHADFVLELVFDLEPKRRLTFNGLQKIELLSIFLLHPVNMQSTKSRVSGYLRFPRRSLLISRFWECPGIYFRRLVPMYQATRQHIPIRLFLVCFFPSELKVHCSCRNSAIFRFLWESHAAETFLTLAVSNLCSFRISLYYQRKCETENVVKPCVLSA
jgi:hypothetical protein